MTKGWVRPAVTAGAVALGALLLVWTLAQPGTPSSPRPAPLASQPTDHP
ncbi:MAG TPA: hypothetical protein VIR57_19295 [Chloroflexota bacterium]